MHILYLSQYFHPEVGATQTRAYEMARGLIQAGHQVTMLTEIPNHPEGVVHPEFCGKLWVRQEFEGIDVIHVWVYTTPNKTMLTRLLFYLTYMINATLAGIFLTRKKYSAIYCTSPPLFVGGAGLALSFLKRLPFYFEVRDLWPQSAIALGELNNKSAQNLTHKLANACYKRAKKVVVVTEGIRNRLLTAGIPASKLYLIRNGANIELFQPRPDEAKALRVELGAENAFVLLYAGILGVAQGLETVIDTAKLLEDEPEIQFWLVGTGPP